MRSIQEQAGGPAPPATEGRRLVARHDAAGPGTPGELMLTIGEVGALAGVVLVAAIATWSLALAQLGHHDGWLATGLGLATTVATTVLVLAMDRRPRILVDVFELGLLGALIAASAFFFFPGFHYSWNDKDPGAYVIHAFAIAREGDVYIDDEVIERGIRPAYDQAGRFPGLWTEADHPTEATSQFFHLYSAMLATADDIAGPRAVFNLTPLLAVGSVCVIALAARRAAGTLVSALAGALLTVSMMQAWQAKYPSTEILAQLLLGGTALAAILAIQRRWAGGALVAGILLGVGFLVRPDGFLYILLATGVVAIAIADARGGRRAVAFFAGLATTFPYAMWNAYSARRIYTESNGVPGPAKLVAALALIVAGGFLGRFVLATIRTRRPDSVWGNPEKLLQRWHLPLGVIASAAFGGALVLLFFRPQIWGEDYQYLLFTNRVERSFDEVNTRWLSWFITPPGLAIMCVGFAVVMLRRWTAAMWVLVVPGALLLPLYLYDAKISMRLMWWVRRFIPAALPAIIILIAIALAWALTRRSNIIKAVGALATIALIVLYADMSLPLRDHDEMAGSWDISAAIAATAGKEKGVFLFPRGGDNNIYSVNRNAPGGVWFVFDQLAARLSANYGMAEVEQYQKAFPDQPVFVVTESGNLPAQLPVDRFSEANAVTGNLTLWEETQDHRPNKEVVLPLRVTVWRLEGPR